MKKLIIILIGISSITFLSCEEDDTTMKEEEEKTDIGIIFADDFSSGDLTYTNGSAKWQSPRKVNIAEKDGNKVADFTFVGSSDLSKDAFAELRFDLGKVYSELWLTYDLFIPSNYHHRDAISSDNNKMFRLWNTN